MSLLIVHQQQPTPDTCTCTSIAMICGMPAGEVIRRFHEGYMTRMFGFGRILDDLGIPYRAYQSDEDHVIDDAGAYLLTVPSLNIPGFLHHLVVEMDEEGEWVVLDPVIGREGKRFYTASLPRSEAELMLAGYQIDAFVSIDYLRDAYSYRYKANGEAA
ncbi:hypothetical protein RPW65_08100 [Pseudomonas sp. NyZ704]|nr:hypothetical protein RPW65_08100 [Pseudomonas sp. NyZ704]